MSTKIFKPIFSAATIILLTIVNALWAADPVTVVTYPLMNRPVIRTPGEDFTIRCNAGASISNWEAQLKTPYNTVSLPITSEYIAETQSWTLTATIPADTPFELYDLYVTASNGIQDEVHHAVRIIPEYKNEFYFIHLPDTHLPAVSWIGYYDDENTVPELRRLIKEFEIINPEFVLQTGDLVDNGQDEAQYQLAQELLADLAVPIYLTGGNHDLWYDGHQNWYKYFGRTMDYSFNYGAYHFAGLEMYDIPSVTFTPEQMQWLQADLNQSIARHDLLRCLFYHYDISRQIDADFVDQYQIDMILYGHTHINGVNFIGTRQAINANTSYTMNNNGEFRLIKVSNGEIVSYPVLKFKHLDVQYSPANDGSNWMVQAKIVNLNPIGFENGLIKFFVPDDPAGYEVQGGTVLQILPFESQKVYYVQVDIQPQSIQTVSIKSLNPPANSPPMIETFSPLTDTTIVSDQPTRFSVHAIDPDGQSLSYQWYLNNTPIPGATAESYDFTPSLEQVGIVTLKVEVTDQTYHDIKAWEVEVERFSAEPRLLTSVVNFFKYDKPVTLQWYEPVPIDARFEYGTSPGNYTAGSIEETGASEVTFVPQAIGMSLGRYYCHITDGTLSSAEFTIIIESPEAPKMLAPVGTTEELCPTFSWEAVPGVSYYMLLCSDQEIVINEDPETGEMTVEGANPIWAVLTPETSVPYGAPDPSGTYTSMAVPLAPGQSYWWVVLNCYGNEPELTSPVQSGVSKFTVNLPPPDLEAPQLLAPANGDTLDSEVITFQWSAVDNAVSYHFYPFKIEIESGIETARPIWESVIATTNCYFDYQAASQLIAGNYRWKVAAVAANGQEVCSQAWDFHYQSPTATLSIHTLDSRGTPDLDDDVALPRVRVEYQALDGIYNGLLLSTDLHGNREDFAIAPGAYIFTASKDGFEAEIDTVRCKEGDNLSLNFRLSPSPCRIFGQVVDNNNDGVENATITIVHNLHPTIQKKTSSDALGNFSISTVPGTYLISAQKEGYHNSTEQLISVLSGENYALETPLVLVKNMSKISGVVVNQDNQLVFGATVTVKKDETVLTDYTDADGHFEFQVDSGTWRLEVSKKGFISPAPRNLYVGTNQTLEVQPNPVLLPNAGMVTGYVTDNQRMLADVTVKAIPGTGTIVSTTSDAFGQFSLNLTSGTYSLQAELSGYTATENPQITVSTGETIADVRLVLAPNRSKIVGLVTTDGSIPLAGVEISCGMLKTITKSNGSYELSVDAGQYTISAFKEGYTSSPVQQVTVAPGQVVEQVNFVLRSNASMIKGWVRSAGKAVYHAQVVAQNSSSISTYTDESGYYVLNVDAGTWDIQVSKEGFQTAIQQDVIVGVGQTAAGINFNLKKNIVTITGQVKEIDHGTPIRNAKVEILDTGATTTTKSDGTYTLIIEPGEYTLCVSKEGYGTVQKTTGSMAPNATVSIDFNLSSLPCRISGVVLDDGSQPVADANVLSISGNDTVFTQTDLTGKYRLDVTAGTYILKVIKPGYALSEGSISVTVSTGEHKKDVNFTLQRQFAGLQGNVRNSLTHVPIAAAKIQITAEDGIGGTVNTDNSGNYQFVDQWGKPFLIPGVYTVTISKSGYQTQVQENIFLQPGETKTLDIELLQNMGWLAGSVTDGSAGVSGATVIALHTDSGERYTEVSDSSGRFQFQNILPGSYLITANKVGYSEPEGITVNTDADNIQIVLVKNIGSFYGTVIDKERGTPIAGAYIYAVDNHGTYAHTYTNSQGEFSLENLSTQYLYNISASKGGYRGDSKPDISAEDTTALRFELERLYGSIAGKVMTPDQVPLDGVRILAISGATSYSDTTDTTGLFSFVHLPSGHYQVTAKKIGYSSDPPQRNVGLWNGESRTDIDFILTEAICSSITIKGPEKVNNSKPEKYSYIAVTADGRPADIEPIWQVDFPAAIDSLSSSGVLYPKRSYIGPLCLMVTDSYSKVQGSLQLSVYQQLDVGNPGAQISDECGASLVIPDSAVAQGLELHLKKPSLPEVRRKTTKFQIVGEVYEFTPAGSKLQKPASLRLPIPATVQNDKNVIGHWNRNILSWEGIGGNEIAAGTLEVNITQLGSYAVLTEAKPLSIENLSLKPNPFSPLIGSLAIKYEVCSNVTTHPIVTAKIYNMIGDLVKTLLNEEPQTKGLNQLYWDGQTDYGRVALNGRYVLHIIVRDRTGSREVLKPFVLIK